LRALKRTSPDHRRCSEIAHQPEGLETLLNRAGTTFRKLPEAAKQGLDERKAIELMLAQPSMIKRPVLDLGQRLLIGFKPDAYESAIARRA
jgi:arsenate reductase (glutaredoxin)